MSINNEISNYQTYLTNAYTKCADKNATIPANKNLQNLTSCIDSIPKHIKLNYLESTGTQYIDTGFKHNQNTRMVADIDFTPNARYCTPFGSWGSESSSKTNLFGSEITNTTLTTLGCYYANVQSWNVTSDFTGRKIWDFNKNVWSIGSNTHTFTAKTFTSLYNDIIFGKSSYDGNIRNFATMKLYSFKIYDNGTLVRDFIPVLYYGIPCLYDKVEKKYYFNQGTGEFVAGDIIVDYIESTGTQWINSDVVSKVETTLKMNVLFKEIPSANTYFYGNNYSNSLLVGLVLYYPSDNRVRWGIRRNSSIAYSTGSVNAPQANIKYNVEAYWGASSQRLIIDGVSRASTTTALTDSGSRELILFGNSQAAVSQLKMRLYDCQIYQNDVLVADFIPVLKADTGEPCLYDKTRNVYKLNSGSGTFLFG